MSPTCAWCAVSGGSAQRRATSGRRGEARGRPAFDSWFASFSKLWQTFGANPIRYPDNFDAARKAGVITVGSPDTVRAEITEQQEVSGCNYWVSRMAYGDLTFEESARSLDLFAAEVIGLPVSVIAGIGAAVLLAIAQRGHVVDNAKVIRGAPWDIVVFSLGMYLVVYGLQNVGLTAQLAAILDALSTQSLWVATVGTGFLAAFLSSIMNNMPTVLVVALSIDASQVSGLVQDAMVYANVVGSDLGPKITPIGSLATLLWLHVLARKGLTIGWGQYFRIGIVLTVPVLLITLTALAGWLAVLH